MSDGKALQDQFLANLSFALELGYVLPFKAKQEINGLVTSHGGHVAYMISRKVTKTAATHNNNKNPPHQTLLTMIDIIPFGNA